MVYSFHMSRNDFGVWRSLIHFIYIIFPHHKRTTFMELIISGVDYDDFWLMCIYYFLHCVIPYCVSSYVQCFFLRVLEDNATNKTSYFDYFVSIMFVFFFTLFDVFKSVILC